MNCESATRLLSLFLYGELTLEEEQSFQDHLEGCAECRRNFEAEKAIHRALEEREEAPPAALLTRCRRDLAERLAREAAPRAGWSGWRGWLEWPGLARPAGAVALAALCFFGGRWTAATAGGTALDPQVARVRYVLPEASGKVRVVIEETRQRLLTGDPGDEQIHRLLLAATRESSDAGLRAESLDILNRRPASDELRGTLLYALEHDPNPGVRLKAMDALKPYAGASEVRSALAKVLLVDDNPGLRTQAIDLLVQKKEDALVGLLQELVQRDSNDYVRLRCQRALQEMDASVGTF
jgi:hypothetical protein